jgi:hypothetical protein
MPWNGVDEEGYFFTKDECPICLKNEHVGYMNKCQGSYYCRDCFDIMYNEQI